jgi:uncharacterized protein (DUF1330 family)
MAIYPTPEQIKQLMDGPVDEPVVMINLLRYKQNADGPNTGATGENAYLRYATRMREFVESKGGRFIWAGRIDSQVIGEGGEGFHSAALVEYPSRRAFLAVMGDPHVKEIGEHRSSGLEMQWLLASTELPLPNAPKQR